MFSLTQTRLQNSTKSRQEAQPRQSMGRHLIKQKRKRCNCVPWLLEPCNSMLRRHLCDTCACLYAWMQCSQLAQSFCASSYSTCGELPAVICCSNMTLTFTLNLRDSCAAARNNIATIARISLRRRDPSFVLSSAVCFFKYSRTRKAPKDSKVGNALRIGAHVWLTRPNYHKAGVQVCGFTAIGLP